MTTGVVVADDQAIVRAGFRLLIDSEPDLTVLIFERVGWTAADYARWSAHLLEQQVGFVTPTRLYGRVCTRFAIVNPLTTDDDLALIVESMK